MMNIVEEAVIFSKYIESLGTIELRLLDLEKDIKTLHSWVTKPYATYWGMLDNSLEQVNNAYQEIENTEGHDAIMGFYNGEPSFLIEKYKASEDVIADFYDAKPSDYGMHILVGPVKKPIHNFTWNVFCTVVEYFFTDTNVERIVVEPDVQNEKIHVLNKKAGFKYVQEIQLPHKKAALAFCEKADFQLSKQLLKDNLPNDSLSNKKDLLTNKEIGHLQKSTWQKANQHLVAKAISEFSHELLLHPSLKKELRGMGYYSIETDNKKAKYYFLAKRKALDHWEINVNSVKKEEEISGINCLQFIVDFQYTLGIPSHLLPTYLEEISSTLVGLAYKLTHQKYTAQQLVSSDFQAVEHAMIEGHPCFVANNGRLGFSTQDYLNYAPETNNNFQLIWLAAHKSKAQFTTVNALNYHKVMHQELGAKTIVEFNNKLEALNLLCEDYLFIPVHPWQWKNKLVNVYAGDIANQHLVFLGKGEDQFSAQQSIRTLYNTSHPNKFYTKTALSILNMGFMRGLSPYYMQSTPPITTWISDLLKNDNYLQKNGFTMLGEVATIGYRNELFEPLGKSLAHNKMLSALWRESPHSKIKKGEKLMTMAAFLHKDKEGVSFVAELIKASSESASSWVKKYLKAYLSPLLHCFYTYEIVFMPHGENIIMVMENHTPVRILMKDITEEVIVFNEEMSLPEHVDRLFSKTSDKMKVLSIFTDVFDCFFRFLSAILDGNQVLSESDFWELVANCVHEYQGENPQLSEKFKTYDLFTEEFDRCCLNRLQLKNTNQMLDLADPIESLQLVGVLQNPIAKYKSNFFNFSAKN